VLLFDQYGNDAKTKIEKLPLERMITETDGPFTKLVNEPTKPWDVAKVIETIASIRGSTHDHVARSIVFNAKNLLS
jgi:TatD DNase family protein